MLLISFPPRDGDESAEVSHCWIDPLPAVAAERCTPRQNHCGRLRTPCSIIMASNFVSVSHHSLLQTLKYLLFISPKTEKSIFLSSSFLSAFHGSSTEFPVCSFLQSKLVLVFPRGFVSALPGITTSHRQQLCLHAEVRVHFPH